MCVCVCMQWPGSGKNVCLLKMTAGCPWLEPWGPAHLLSWKMWRHRDGGTGRPGQPVRWCVGRSGAEPAGGSHLEGRRTAMLIGKGRKPRGRGVATKLTCPPVLKCSENTSSPFLRNQMWDRAFWKVQQRTSSNFPEGSLNLSGWFTLLSKCSPRPPSQLHFLWEACRYWVLKLATLPGILIIS